MSNAYAYHALAIDEHRKAFRPTLWTNMGADPNAPIRPIERGEQRWFVGAHANVGGGCFTDSLAQLPLKWLEGKATQLGLTFDDQFATPAKAELGPISDSFSEFLYRWYPLLRLWIRYYRGIGVPPKEEGEGVKTINETIDSSVFNRWREDPSYRPRNLLIWAKTKKVSVTQLWRIAVYSQTTVRCQALFSY